MKNRITQKNVAIAAALLACVTFATSTIAQQPDRTQEKIRLMVEAITFNENGDYASAKKSLEELLKIAPEDQRVQQLLAKTNSDLESAQAAQAAAAAAAAQAKADADAAHAATVAAQEAADADAAASATAAAASAEEAATAEAAMKEAVRKQGMSISASQRLIADAYDAADDGRYDEALNYLDQAEAKLPQARTADKVRAQIREARADFAYDRTVRAAKANNIPLAKKYAEEYAANEPNKAKGDSLMAKLDKLDQDPYNHTLNDVNPDYVARQKKISALLESGRIQYLYGDYQGAIATYRSIQTMDSDNIEAKAYLSMIYEKLNKTGARTYEESRSALLDEVNRSWQRPQLFTRGAVDQGPITGESPIQLKLENIILPEVSFPAPGVPLVDALNTLSELSMLHDKSPTGAKGINIIAKETADAGNVSLTLRNLSLQQILSFVTKQVGYQYDIENGAVVVSKARVDTNFETYNFPLSTSAVIRITGYKSSSGDSGASTGPFAFDSGAAATATAGGEDQSAGKIKAFLERAGVDFGPGASIAYDGSVLWVTNSLRNIEKVRRILQRYKEVLQVEIEAKFLEVNQGTLKELNFNWSVYNKTSGNVLFSTYNRSTEGVTSLNNRTLASTFSPSKSSQPITISTQPTMANPDGTAESINQIVPSLPSTINLATDSVDTVSTVLGIINGYNVDLLVQAIEQKTGSDLLSSPKVTVMSGVTATITVAQEMLYPTTWGDTQSNVGSSSGSSSGTTSSAGVTITPGTPQDFTKREVGVTMEVTPTVDESDRSITLDLTPRVTEFEGFMEYGGVAIAISSGTTVTVPSGFVQPVFSVREIKTQVTIFDGATVVLGGLTREEVKTVSDQVPVLGNIPLIGRLFQSNGESRQKKNLLVFVTANSISPGGSLSSEQVGDVRPGSVFQNPTIVSPSGTLQRTPDLAATE